MRSVNSVSGGIPARKFFGAAPALSALSSASPPGARFSPRVLESLSVNSLAFAERSGPF
jgi:hypothetical protein